MSGSSDPATRLVYGKDDALFGAIEEQQGAKPFGSFLDAGTGMHSLRWIATLKSKGMTGFTAVTADKNMQKNVQRESDALGVSDIGQIEMGNWFESTTTGTTKSASSKTPLLDFPDASFDTILADYLIGAMDGFSPFKQDLMIPKLARLLKPGGRLYIVGLEPIPDSVPGDANIIAKVRQVRDACILLAGHRCYREYPLSWVKRQVLALSSEEQQHGSLELLTSLKFPILYRQATIRKQIEVARSKFPFFEEPSLKTAMAELLDDLENESLKATVTSPKGRISQGFDYVVVAERKNSNDNGSISAEAGGTSASSANDENTPGDLSDESKFR